ncbi:MAG: pyridine nucleotide-disulfide oxidoreductase [endosymbiont of Galathealinum brachiosum]|uniref:Sulfide-quinone reductase n=1 Tax=endosymbiont of Galathealinum brachiosum TaxID=2200906 RepID=A0A370D850_9GAMM|nr:MAG: pyridine nucleotide-disulfide oxidoreductase [endosymbiont of Galathealinum brachiosum]
MAHIAIIGAGVGGLPCAYEMREELGNEHTITVINNRDHFQFTPSNPWVAVGWRTAKDIAVPLKPILDKKGIELIVDTVTELDAENNMLKFTTTAPLQYDYLVIATGPRLAFEEVPGSGPDGGHTSSICTSEHALTAYKQFQDLLDNPGPIVIGAMPFASCFGPAYEFAFIVDAELRKRKVRNKFPMTYVTSEPYIGHLGLGGVGDSKSMLESDLRAHDIKFITNAKTTKVEEGKLFAEELDTAGNVLKEHEIDFNFSMMLPAFKGVDAIANVEGLCNPRGFVLIDDHQRNPKYSNIYSAGVCVAIPPVEPTPVPTGAPKTGYMIETMATAIVKNIGHELKGEAPEKCGTWNAICLADMGDTGAAFVAIPQIPPRNVTWFKKGKWVHQAKIGFEKYFLRKMRKGKTDSVFEVFILKALGIEKLEK